MSDDPSTTLSDSDGEYHTCDEDENDDADDDKVSGDPRAGCPSSSSSDGGIDWLDYYHSSDDEEEEELDVLGAAAPVVAVKKETSQLYTSKITGLDQQVQEILESCGQTERNIHQVPTSGSWQDEGLLDVARSQQMLPIPILGSQPSDNTMAVATPGAQQLEEPLSTARPHTRYIVPTTASQQEKDILAVATTHHRQVVQTHDNTLAATRGVYNALVQMNVNVTQQQFGDVTVEKATNINQSFGGKQNISKTATFHEERKRAELSRSEIIMNRTLQHIESWNQGMIKTAALAQVLNKLENGTNWLTIKGNPGEGKTTVGYMALEELHRRGRQVFEVRSPEEFSEVISTGTSPVIMLDDVFGNLEFDQIKWSSWQTAVGPVLEEREHKSHEKKDKTAKRDATIILVGRDYVLNSASGDLGRLSAFLTSDKYVICMDHSMQRETEEKSAIWESISRSSGVQLDQHTVDKILRIDVAHGFPHVCRLFVTLHKQNKEIKAEEFFRKPLEFLNHSISNFFKDAQKLQLFKEIVKNGGKVSIRELRRLDPMYKVIQAAASMVGSYLRMEDDSYLFDHPSIYDSVAFNLCSLDPVCVIQQCHLAFIHERVRLRSVRNTSSTARQEPSHVAFVDSTYADELAERFVTEIVKKNFYYVLSHQAFTDGSFVQKVMSQVEVPLSTLIYQTDQVMLPKYDTFLTLVPSSKSPELMKYLDTCMELSEVDEETILYGSCKRAALQVLTYLINTRSSLYINIIFFNISVCWETPLIIASQTGDTQFIQQILLLKPDLNASDLGRRTALHYLSMNGMVSLVINVIDNGAKIDVADRWGKQTPLCYACKQDHMSVVELLIGKGARIDRTTLESACLGGNIDIVKLLLENETTLNDNKTLNSCLCRACEYNNIGVVQLLIERGAIVDEITLNSARRGGNSDVVKLLLKTKTSLNDSHTSEGVLRHACENDSVGVLKCLVHQGASVNTPTELNSLLSTACRKLIDADCEHEIPQALEWLLRESVDYGCQDRSVSLLDVHDGNGNTALHRAALWGSVEGVELLVKSGATVNLQNLDGDTALYNAAGKLSKECVDILLRAGAVVNIQNETGNTPLHRAAGNMSKECVDILLRAGAVVNIQNETGNTPLHRAAGNMSKECVDILLRAGAVVNIQNETGNTPLHRAAGNMSKECVDILLRAGAVVNIQNKAGNTALHRAMFVGSKQCADVLISSGAAVNTQNADGNTPLHIAVFPKIHVEPFNVCVCEVLIQQGADVNKQNNEGETPLHILSLCQKFVANAVNRDIIMALTKQLLDAGADANIQDKQGKPALYGVKL